MRFARLFRAILNNFNNLHKYTDININQIIQLSFTIVSACVLKTQIKIYWDIPDKCLAFVTLKIDIFKLPY